MHRHRYNNTRAQSDDTVTPKIGHILYVATYLPRIRPGYFYRVNGANDASGVFAIIGAANIIN